MPRATHGTAAADATTPRTALTVLDALLDQLGSIGATLRRHFSTDNAPASPVQWKTHIPQLARTIADMIDLQPELFTWLRFGSAALRTTEQELLLLTELRAFLDSLVSHVETLLRERKAALFSMTTQVVDGLRSAAFSPLVPEATRDRLGEISQAVMSIVEERSAAARAKRHETLAQRAAQMKEAEHLRVENRILRGERIESAPPAGRTRRRSRR